MTSADAIALQLEGGARVVLQRVPPTLAASAVAGALGGRVVSDLAAAPGGPRVLDCRGWAEFPALDPIRETLGDPASPLVVLLDHDAASVLARTAPHLVSWAGGIALPPDHPLRGARTDAEVEQGERALRTVLADDPGLAERLSGQEVAVDLRTRRWFTGSGTATALEVAREHLDDGIVYLERLP